MPGAAALLRRALPPRPRQPGAGRGRRCVPARREDGGPRVHRLVLGIRGGERGGHRPRDGDGVGVGAECPGARVPRAPRCARPGASGRAARRQVIHPAETTMKRAGAKVGGGPRPRAPAHPARAARGRDRSGSPRRPLGGLGVGGRDGPRTSGVPLPLVSILPDLGRSAWFCMFASFFACLICSCLLNEISVGIALRPPCPTNYISLVFLYLRKENGKPGFSCRSRILFALSF